VATGRRNRLLTWEPTEGATYDEPYELNDPKHPTAYERWADWADMLRKRKKEESLSEPDMDSGPRGRKLRGGPTGNEGCLSGSESDEVEGHSKP